MHPSTEAEGSSEFAADVLRNLLALITQENAQGNDTFLVSHGWTDGPMMYLVYKAPPSTITWGLVRNTRESIIDPAPWPSLEVAVRYYYLLDLCENRVSASFCHPGTDSDVILWHGDQSYSDGRCAGLPEYPADVPDAFRYTASPISAGETRQEPSPVIEPRRYADPNGPLPPGARRQG